MGSRQITIDKAQEGKLLGALLCWYNRAVGRSEHVYKISRNISDQDTEMKKYIVKTQALLQKVFQLILLLA